jgi:class 3 adenylate cyclase
VTTLDSRTRAGLPDSAFAYIDSKGRRRLPVNDASHVRNALARFEQTAFEDDGARERARERLLRAAKRFGIVPLGFFDGQLRKERFQAELAARGTEVRHLPRGTVTFLFTDIEGSTRLVQRLGNAYAGVLRGVRAIIRSGVRRAGGCEVDARADEFFAAFAEADRAVAAALAIQRRLHKRTWPGVAAVRVRIGIHTGRPKLTETGYIGVDVNTAARVCSATNGGQILLSAAARDALIAPVTGVELRRLGAYTLAGLEAPAELFQAHAPDLPADFPEPRSATPVGG